MLGNLELIARLVLATALGSVIGVERDRLRQLPCVKEFKEDDSTS